MGETLGLAVCHYFKAECEALITSSIFPDVVVMACPGCSNPSRDFQFVSHPDDYNSWKGLLHLRNKNCHRAPRFDGFSKPIITREVDLGIFINRTLLESYDRDSSFIVNSGVLHLHRQNDKGFRDFLPSQKTSRVIILHTLLNYVLDEEIIEGIESTGIRLDILPVGLDHLALYLDNELNQIRNAEMQKSETTRAITLEKSIAKQLFTLESIAEIAASFREEEVISKILQALETLFQPESISYLQVVDGEEGEFFVRPQLPEVSRANRTHPWDLHNTENPVIILKDNEFELRLVNKNDVLGIVRLERLKLPFSKKGYNTVMFLVTKVCSLAIHNARSYQKIEIAEERIRILGKAANSIHEGILVMDIAGTVIYMNKAFGNLSGYSVFELNRRGGAMTILADNSKAHEIVAALMRDGHWSGEVLTKTMDCQDRSMQLSADVIRDEQGVVVGVIGIYVDITDKKRAEEALRVSEERFAKAFNAGPTLMCINSLIDSRFIDVNESFIRVTGFSKEEIIGYSWQEIYSKAYWKGQNASKDLDEIPISNLEISFRSKEGNEHIGLLSREKIQVRGEECIFTVIQDVTEMKHLQKEMARLDRLNLIGEMAAGIGHEIRNPLTTISGFLQLLSRKESLQPYGEEFALMIDEVDRVNSIITEYLSLAKDKLIAPKLQDLNGIITAIYPLLAADALLNDKIIVLNLGNIPYLMLDEKEIRQLIYNITRNGLDAMSKGGRLDIETYEDNNKVILAIKDQGAGIPSYILEKLGTPFLTTKEEGTGLGLAVCFSIVARHKASLDIRSGEAGTTVYIAFEAS